MHIEADDASRGYIIRRWVGGGKRNHDRSARHLWLAGIRDDGVPIWSERPDAFIFASREARDYIRTIYSKRELTIQQPGGYQAARDAFGADYLRHKLGW
jgi:hypothetical protein